MWAGNLRAALRTVDKSERLADAYLPQWQHLGDPHSHVVRHVDGAIWACFEVQGASWEDLDDGGRDMLHEQVCELYRSFAFRRRLGITLHLVRHEARPEDWPQLPDSNAFSRRIESRYRAAILGGSRLFRNRIFFGILVRPERIELRGLRVPVVPAPVVQGDIEALEQAVATVQADLSDFGLRLLGIRNERGGLYSEPAEALYMVLTGRKRKVPLHRGKLAKAICSFRPVFERRQVRLEHSDTVDHAAFFCFSSHHKETVSWALDDLLAAPYRFVLAQSFNFMPLHEAQDLVTRRWNQWVSSNDPAYEQRDVLKHNAAGDLQSRMYGLGVHNLTLMVLADSEQNLVEATKTADVDIRNTRCVVSRVSWDVESAYFGMMPGTEPLHARAVPITTRNFATHGPMRNYRRGWRGGDWCDYLALFTASGGTPFYWNPHTAPEGGPGHVPHCFWTGPTRTGKTTHLLAMLAMARGKAGVRVLFWDKDRSGKLAVYRMGGRYFEFAIGVSTGLASLKRHRGDDPHDMAHLMASARARILSDGGPQLRPEEDARLELGLKMVMRMPAKDRSWNQVRAFLGTSDDGPGARLRRWCKGYEFGWVDDNDEDLVDIGGDSSVYGFDQTHYLNHPIVCGVIQSELFYRMQRLTADGKPTIMAIDECWASFLNQHFRAKIHDAIKTGIKQGVAVWLSTQSPKDVINSDVGHTVREQCMTHFHFGNASAEEADFCEGGLALRKRGFEWIKYELPKGGKGRFLLKQGEQYTPCQFDLSGDALEDIRVELSGNTLTVNLFDRCLADTYDDDIDGVFEEFHRRRRLPEFRRKLKRYEEELEDAA